MKVALQDDGACLCIDLVHIVLRGSNKDVLDAIAQSVDEGLGKDLLGHSIVGARKLGLVEETELGAPYNGGVHVVVILVASSGDISAPSDGVGRGQRSNLGAKKKDITEYHKENEWRGMPASKSHSWLTEIFDEGKRVTLPGVGRGGKATDDQLWTSEKRFG